MMDYLKTLHEEARSSILKIQEENRNDYNKKIMKARVYKKGDLVAIQRTQFETGVKQRTKFFRPYEMTRIRQT